MDGEKKGTVAHRSTQTRPFRNPWNHARLVEETAEAHSGGSKAISGPVSFSLANYIFLKSGRTDRELFELLLFGLVSVGVPSQPCEVQLL